MAISVPESLTVVNHGLLLSFDNKVVGGIFEWGDSHAMTATPAHEFGAVTDTAAESGEPYEHVQGNATGMELTIGRYDIWTARFERAFGSLDLTMLTRQKKSWTFREYYNSPDGTQDFGHVYQKCLFTRTGRRQSAQGDRIVMVNASAVFTRKRIVSA